jgi:hypothetical protein
MYSGYCRPRSPLVSAAVDAKTGPDGAPKRKRTSDNSGPGAIQPRIDETRDCRKPPIESSQERRRQDRDCVKAPGDGVSESGSNASPQTASRIVARPNYNSNVKRPIGQLGIRVLAMRPVAALGHPRIDRGRRRQECNKTNQSRKGQCVGPRTHPRKPTHSALRERDTKPVNPARATNSQSGPRERAPAERVRQRRADFGEAWAVSAQDPRQGQTSSQSGLRSRVVWRVAQLFTVAQYEGGLASV